MSARTKHTLLLAAVGLFILAAQANATVYYWDGGGGDGEWLTSTNWDPDGIPALDDQTYFKDDTLTGTQTVNLGSNANTSYIYLQAPATADYVIDSTGGYTLTMKKNGSILNYNADHSLTFEVPIVVSAVDYMNVQANTQDITFNEALCDGQNPNIRVKQSAGGRVILNGGRTTGSLNTLQFNGESFGHAVLGHQNAIGDDAVIQISSADTTVVNGVVGLTADVDAGCLYPQGGASGTTLTVCVEEGDTDRTLTLSPSVGGLAGYSKAAGHSVILGDNFNGDDGHIAVKVLSGFANEFGVGCSWAVPTTEIKSGNTLSFEGTYTFVTPIVEMYEYFANSGMGCDFTGDGTLIIADHIAAMFGKEDGTVAHGNADIGGNLTLQVDGSLDINGKNQTWATLTGTGTIKLYNDYVGGATLTVNSLQPGNSAGTLTIDEDGTVNIAGATFELDALAGDSDQLVVSEADVNVSGTIEIVDLGGIEIGDYTLVSMGTGSASLGSFTLDLPTYCEGSLALSSGDVVLSITAVPEPATLILLTLGGLAVIRRRRK